MFVGGGDTVCVYMRHNAQEGCVKSLWITLVLFLMGSPWCLEGAEPLSWYLYLMFNLSPDLLSFSHSDVTDSTGWSDWRRQVTRIASVFTHVSHSPAGMCTAGLLPLAPVSYWTNKLLLGPQTASITNTWVNIADPLWVLCEWKNVHTHMHTHRFIQVI